METELEIKLAGAREDAARVAAEKQAAENAAAERAAETTTAMAKEAATSATAAAKAAENVARDREAVERAVTEVLAAIPPRFDRSALSRYLKIAYRMREKVAEMESLAGLASEVIHEMEREIEKRRGDGD